MLSMQVFRIVIRAAKVCKKDGIAKILLLFYGFVPEKWDKALKRAFVKKRVLQYWPCVFFV